ncbi:unnamed protein product [Thelazia callipaeda]|uniref:Secreted protein n=1 Tax=Thelazia callipaeda TaxID=103827 RepID=A0A0N5CM40_THECL|nr:unnamed protein product [Thelazia callipaeda]
MIFFVWSLVLSAVQFARRQRLLSVLNEYFISNHATNSVLICQPVQFLSCFSANIESHETSNCNLDTLRKANSEPCLPDASIPTLIYRTEEVEFLVKSSAVRDNKKWFR